MKFIADGIDRLNLAIGRGISWLILAMVFVTFFVVVLRYFFNTGWVWMQELVLYFHSAVFLLGVGYALLKDAHVRVDIFYRRAKPVTQAWVNALGCLLLWLPTCVLVFYQAYPYVWDSWSVFEGSKDGGGLEGVFILKTMILLFCMIAFLQGISLFIRSVLIIKGDDHG